VPQGTVYSTFLQQIDKKLVFMLVLAMFVAFGARHQMDFYLFPYIVQ